jgi:hypothetical protein
MSNLESFEEDVEGSEDYIDITNGDEFLNNLPPKFW